jgi:hypothetical protein
MQGLSGGQVAAPKDGGYAQTGLAKKNYELTKPWLESVRKRHGV